MADKWLTVVERKPAAKYRLVYFGWSGNRCGRGSDCGPHKPVNWSHALADFEVHEICLPGHGVRMNEAPYSGSVVQLVQEMAAALREVLMRDSGGPGCCRPFCFVGFAFGAILAHEVAVEMGEYALRTKEAAHICTAEIRESYTKRPFLVVAVSCEAPSWAGRILSKNHTLSDAAFVEELRRQGGTEELLAIPEALELFLPIVKADVRLEENYEFTPDRATSSSAIIAIYGGKPSALAGASQVTDEAAEAWVALSGVKISRVVRVDQLDWFLLETEEGVNAVLSQVRQHLEKWVQPFVG